MLDLDQLDEKTWYEVTIEHEDLRYVYQVRAYAPTYAVRFALFTVLKVFNWDTANIREWALMDLNEIMLCLPDTHVVCDVGKAPDVETDEKLLN